jgi:hypothetical protein
MAKSDNKATDGLYSNQLVTVEHLDHFKDELLEQIKRLVSGKSPEKTKRWLKSDEVRKMLNISRGKLQQLRVSRQLAFMKIGGIIYYDQADIDTMFKKNRIPTR